MEAALVKKASQMVPDSRKMIRMIANRARELVRGAKPLVHATEGKPPAEIALLELIAGKLIPQDDVNEKRELHEFVDKIVAARFPSMAGK